MGSIHQPQINQDRVFNVHIQSKLEGGGGYSARLSRAEVPVFTGSFVLDRKKQGEGVREDRLTGGYQGVQAIRPESVAGGGCFEVLWNLECPVGLSQREICAHFNEGKLSQFGRSVEK